LRNTHVGDDRNVAHAAHTDAALAAEFAEVARVLAAIHTVDALLTQIVTTAVAAIEPCGHAGLFVIERGSIRTTAPSDDTVLSVDALQWESGEGPCIEVARGRSAYKLSNDLANDAEFPRFGPRSASLGVRSALALLLFTDRPYGSLNFYAPRPRAFGVVDRAKALILASHASTALMVLEQRTRDANVAAQNLRHALASRSIIGQAQGILMERERINSDQAFDVLRRASQELNVKLRDIAQRLVDTGETP
jgi:hypothetical protein